MTQRTTASRGATHPRGSAPPQRLLLSPACAPGRSPTAAPQGAPPPDGDRRPARRRDHRPPPAATARTDHAGQRRVPRSRRGPNATSGTITVDVTYGGTLVAGADYEPLPDPVAIAAGQNAHHPRDPCAHAAGTITMTVEPGAGYTVGAIRPPPRSTLPLIADLRGRLPGTDRGRPSRSGDRHVRRPDPDPRARRVGEIFDSQLRHRGRRAARA